MSFPLVLSEILIQPWEIALCIWFYRIPNLSWASFSQSCCSECAICSGVCSKPLLEQVAYLIFLVQTKLPARRSKLYEELTESMFILHLKFCLLRSLKINTLMRIKPNKRLNVTNKYSMVYIKWVNILTPYLFWILKMYNVNLFGSSIFPFCLQAPWRSQ